MTPEQQAAFIMAQAACAMAEIAGMQADNQLAALNHQPPQWIKPDFDRIISGNIIGHNAVISFFQG